MGHRRIVVVNGREIGIFNIGGQFFALRNRCAHQGGPVCEGILLARLESHGPGHYDFDPSRVMIECPWHGWEFDIETGQSWFDPTRTRVGRYQVRVESPDTLNIDPSTGLAMGPYVLETYPVSMKSDVVVVEMAD